MLSKKIGFHKFQVEKREGTPYRTGSYLPGGAALGKPGREEAGCPPVFLRRKAVEEHAVGLNLPSAEGQVGVASQRT
jgi:hypothetical protein